MSSVLVCSSSQVPFIFTRCSKDNFLKFLRHQLNVKISLAIMNRDNSVPLPVYNTYLKVLLIWKLHLLWKIYWMTLTEIDSRQKYELDWNIHSYLFKTLIFFFTLHICKSHKLSPTRGGAVLRWKLVDERCQVQIEVALVDLAVWRFPWFSPKSRKYGLGSLG